VPELPKIPRFDGLTPVDARKLKELGVLPPELREDIRRMSHQLRQLTPEAEAQRANERLASLRQDLADRKAALEALWREFEAQEAEARREIADLEEQLRKAEAWAAQFGIHPLRQASVTAPTPVEQPEPPAETHVDPPLADTPPDPQPHAGTPVEPRIDPSTEETPADPPKETQAGSQTEDQPQGNLTKVAHARRAVHALWSNGRSPPKGIKAQLAAVNGWLQKDWSDRKLPPPPPPLIERDTLRRALGLRK
jgi:hypothetical protein